MTYIPQAQKTEGNITESRVSDDNVQRLLANVLKELKKINLHLSVMSDQCIKDEDVDR